MAPARAAAPAEVPKLPYYSIQVDTARTRTQALQKLKPYASEPFARAEHRKSGWQVRVGAWTRPGEANREMPHLAQLGSKKTRRLAMESNVDWLLPDGTTLKVGGSAPEALAPKPAAPAKAVETAAAPAPSPLLPAPAAAKVQPPIALSDDFRKSALQLDTEVRRWIRDNGPTRRDHAIYGMDVAPLMLYAAQRGDRALYETLLPAAEKLILDAKETGPYTAGFVLWRRAPGVKPEVSGAQEALWMARALWAGSKAFDRPGDHALALRVLDGYGRHAFELQGFWLVRKYFAFDSGTFVNLSSIAGYDGDFIADVLKEAALPALQNFPERSYAMVERTRNPAGLLNPLIQPEVGLTWLDMGLETYAPNGLAPVLDACLGAEGAVRGAPKTGRSVLDFATSRHHRDFQGNLHAYYDARSGEAIGDPMLSGEGYACLARLALALGDTGALEKLAEPLRFQMEQLGEAPQVSEAPLYSAGPILLAVYAMGAFTPSP